MSNYVDTPNCRETQRKSYDSTIHNQGTYQIYLWNNIKLIWSQIIMTHIFNFKQKIIR